MLTCSWRFLMSHELEQLEFKLEKIIGIQKHAGKVRKCQIHHLTAETFSCNNNGKLTNPRNGYVYNDKNWIVFSIHIHLRVFFPTISFCSHYCIQHDWKKVQSIHALCTNINLIVVFSARETNNQIQLAIYRVSICFLNNLRQNVT